MIDALQHNIFLWPVMLCALLSLLISAERFGYLLFRASIASAPFMAEIQRRVLANELDAAIRHCNAEPWAPLPRVVRAALLAAPLPREEMVMAVDQALLDVTSDVQRRVGYLATIANVATLLGLLGTIVGLIQSFDAVSKVSLEEKQTMLAAGIAIAMYTTAAGIAVAIPTLVAYSILVQRGNIVLDDAERCGLKVTMLLLARQKGGTAG
jgi:biopolymer transport protein ExbB